MFTYENLIRHRVLYNDDTSPNFNPLIEKQTSFIRFGYIGTNPSFVQKVQAPAGWKLHIAIDDTIPGNVARAWDIVKDILIEQRIAEAKVIKPNESFANDKTQRGKQITIYQFYNPDRNWAAIINEIESRLLRAGIKEATQPNPTDSTDRQIVGSRFITYRNDLSDDGRRSMKAIEVMPYQPEKRYNPFSRPDPFAGIRINYQTESAFSSSSPATP